MITLPTEKPAPVETAQFSIGADVSCAGEPCGKLTRVIIDPIRRTLTHLVVEGHDQTLGRLVPLKLVVSATPKRIDLACPPGGFDALAASKETDYFPMDDCYGPYFSGYARGYGYGWGNASFWPNYGYGGLGYSWGWEPRSLSYESTPDGEVTIRRGDPVRATDGEIGHVAGLVIGTPAGDVTHVLLQEGHLWGKKDVAIPIRSVKRVAGVIEVALTKHALEALPEIDIDHPEAKRMTT